MKMRLSAGTVGVFGKVVSLGVMCANQGVSPDVVQKPRFSGPFAEVCQLPSEKSAGVFEVGLGVLVECVTRRSPKHRWFKDAVQMSDFLPEMNLV